MIELYFFLVGFFIACSMVLSTSEAGIFSLSRIELVSLKTFYIPAKYNVVLRNPEELLIVLLAGNEIADFFASFFFAKSFIILFGEYGKEIAFLLYGILGFWLGDFFPKIIGFKYNTKVVPRVLPIVTVFYYLFFPVRKVFNFFSKKIENYLLETREIKVKEELFTPVEQLILEAIEVAYKEKKISEKEKLFIYGLFLSEKISVSTVMIPRSEVIALEDQIIDFELLEKLKTLPDEIPVYKESLDNILGIFYTKEFIKSFKPELLGKVYISEFLKEAFFVNENFKLRDILFEFQKRNVKIAIVVDEYGAFKGIITLEDILEELFGEFYEEYEEKIEEIREIGENKWLVSGKILLEELQHLIGFEVDEEYKSVKTLNGFLLALFKEVPEIGQSIQYKEFKFTIKKKKKRKILLVEIEKITND